SYTLEYFSICFYFQAEDGIRYRYVTGVQTCALPIFTRPGEYVDSQALAPEGLWVRYGGEGRPPVTDGPFAETKDLIAGWMIIDVESPERAIELAGELSAAPGHDAAPIPSWTEVRPFYGVTPPTTG